MVNVTLEPFLPARHLFQMSLCRASTFLLQPSSQSIVSFPHFFYLLTTENLTITVGGKVFNSKINAKCATYRIKLFLIRSIDNCDKVKLPIFVYQISLSPYP